MPSLNFTRCFLLKKSHIVKALWVFSGFMLLYCSGGWLWKHSIVRHGLVSISHALSPLGSTRDHCKMRGLDDCSISHASMAFWKEKSCVRPMGTFRVCFMVCMVRIAVHSRICWHAVHHDPSWPLSRNVTCNGKLTNVFVTKCVAANAGRRR